MRFIITTLIFLPLLATAGPARDVFMHECNQANNDNKGFKCQGIEGRYLNLQLLKKDMAPADKKHFKYEFNKLILRYIELGGTYIHITSKYWPQNSLRSCQATKDRTSYTCYGCTWVDKGDGNRSCE